MVEHKALAAAVRPNHNHRRDWRADASQHCNPFRRQLQLCFPCHRQHQGHPAAQRCSISRLFSLLLVCLLKIFVNRQRTVSLRPRPQRPGHPGLAVHPPLQALPEQATPLASRACRARPHEYASGHVRCWLGPSLPVCKQAADAVMHQTRLRCPLTQGLSATETGDTEKQQRHRGLQSYWPGSCGSAGDSMQERSCALLKCPQRVSLLSLREAGKGEGGGSACAGQVGRGRTLSTDAGWCARTAGRLAVPLPGQPRVRYVQRVRQVYSKMKEAGQVLVAYGERARAARGARTRCAPAVWQAARRKAA